MAVYVLDKSRSLIWAAFLETHTYMESRLKTDVCCWNKNSFSPFSPVAYSKNRKFIQKKEFIKKGGEKERNREIGSGVVYHTNPDSNNQFLTLRIK